VRLATLRRSVGAVPTLRRSVANRTASLGSGIRAGASGWASYHPFREVIKERASSVRRLTLSSRYRFGESVPCKNSLDESDNESDNRSDSESDRKGIMGRDPQDLPDAEWSVLPNNGRTKGNRHNFFARAIPPAPASNPL